MNVSVEKCSLEFKKPARTSRGAYSEKNSWLIKISENGYTGVGEASPLPDLSPDMYPDRYEEHADLGEIYLSLFHSPDFAEKIPFYPALKFAHECALLDVKLQQNGILFNTDFTAGRASIPINGLVWMDTAEEMLEQAFQKIEAGFTCIKFKIGALDHDEECRLLEKIRARFSAFKLQIRLDANGAFLPGEALEKLQDFSRFEVHSLEQPIQAGQADMMEEICHKSAIPIALDEELIGIIPGRENCEKLLKKIKPKYLVLKPTLLGGFSAADTWIAAAEKYGIGWWATSALEGNTGLSHIAQWLSTKPITLHQGLGTGALYKNNFPPRTILQGEQMWFVNQA